MEHLLRKNGEAMRNKVRSTERPSEHSERLERLVMCSFDTRKHLHNAFRRHSRWYSDGTIKDLDTPRKAGIGIRDAFFRFDHIAFNRHYSVPMLRCFAVVSGYNCLRLKLDHHIPEIDHVNYFFFCFLGWARRRPY